MCKLEWSFLYSLLMLFRLKHLSWLTNYTLMRCSRQKGSFLTLKIGTLSKGAIFALNMILYPEHYRSDASVLFISYHYFIFIIVLCVISQRSHISLLCSFFFLGSSFQSKFWLSHALSLFTYCLLVCNAVQLVHFVVIKYFENKHGCMPTLWSVSEVHCNFR